MGFTFDLTADFSTSERNYIHSVLNIYSGYHKIKKRRNETKSVLHSRILHCRFALLPMVSPYTIISLAAEWECIHSLTNLFMHVIIEERLVS